MVNEKTFPLKEGLRRAAARFLARHVFPRFAHDPKAFDLFQSYGYHLVPVHYYSPLPDTANLPAEIWKNPGGATGIDFNEAGQKAMVEEFVSRYDADYKRFPADKTRNANEFYINNGSFGTIDAEILWGMIRRHKPKRFIEIGAGFSTLLSAQAIRANRKDGYPCQFTVVEPYPHDFIRRGVEGVDELVADKVQNVPLTRFQNLAEGDILFIDSSHVCKVGSDVSYEFLDILPQLQPGVIIHIHDIFLPKEYPQGWICGMHRFWNEQYILQALLTHNQNFEVLWSGYHMHESYPELLSKAFHSYRADLDFPGSFWIRRSRTKMG